jgi:23S rRNA (cytidine1920-2'-O)/16S rRNA (cytidine1409-2'-O)-methyltransferase
MVRRGIAGSRSEAALAIRSGKVIVGGHLAAKASTLVLPDEPIAVSAPARRYVSRGGEKLEAALERFGIDVSGAQALDAGASSGGFTDCLLSRGAGHVVAVDVGYGQFDWRLREDPRVTLLERTNVRTLKQDLLPYAPDLVTTDLSFISIGLALPALVQCSAPEASYVLLVKPQFEVGRKEIGRRGVVTDPALWRRVIISIVERAVDLGLRPLEVMASPLLGPAGNAEFLVWMRGPDSQDMQGQGQRAGSFTRSADQAVVEATKLARVRSAEHRE